MKMRLRLGFTMNFHARFRHALVCPCRVVIHIVFHSMSELFFFFRRQMWQMAEE